MARSSGRLRLKRGSTVGVLERSSRTRVVARNGTVNEPSIFMDHFLVQGIATMEGVVKLVCQRWVRPAGQAASGTGQPNEVVLEEPNELVILVAQQVKQVALVLRSQLKMFFVSEEVGLSVQVWIGMSIKQVFPLRGREGIKAWGIYIIKNNSNDSEL